MNEGSVSGGLSSTEQEIAAVWASELGAQCVAPESDFFELGGNSVSMANMLLRVGNIFSVALSLGALFRNPTLGEFSRVVEDAAKEINSFHNLM